LIELSYHRSGIRSDYIIRSISVMETEQSSGFPL
jgi:hypothetical protein